MLGHAAIHAAALERLPPFLAGDPIELERARHGDPSQMT